MLLFPLCSLKIAKWQQQLLTVVLQAARTGTALLQMLRAEILTAASSFISEALHGRGYYARGFAFSLHFPCPT